MIVSVANTTITNVMAKYIGVNGGYTFNVIKINPPKIINCNNLKYFFIIPILQLVELHCCDDVDSYAVRSWNVFAIL
jgi:hypothetical protein